MLVYPSVVFLDHQSPKRLRVCDSLCVSLLPLRTVQSDFGQSTLYSSFEADTCYTGSRVTADTIFPCLSLAEPVVDEQVEHIVRRRRVSRGASPHYPVHVYIKQSTLVPGTLLQVLEVDGTAGTYTDDPAAEQYTLFISHSSDSDDRLQTARNLLLVPF